MMELLKSAGLFLKDPQSGKEGITLWGTLIFGKEELIHAAMPHYRADAILRKSDVFKTIIPMSNNDGGQVNWDDRIEEIIKYCKEPRSRNEIQSYNN